MACLFCIAFPFLNVTSWHYQLIFPFFWSIVGVTWWRLILTLLDCWFADLFGLPLNIDFLTLCIILFVNQSAALMSIGLLYEGSAHPQTMQILLVLFRLRVPLFISFWIGVILFCVMCKSIKKLLDVKTADELPDAWWLCLIVNVERQAHFVAFGKDSKVLSRRAFRFYKMPY